VIGSAGITYVLEASSDLIHWIPVFTNAAPFSYPAPAADMLFYRAVR
jgi:hypothetical protein